MASFGMFLTWEKSMDIIERLRALEQTVTIVTAIDDITRLRDALRTVSKIAVGFTRIQGDAFSKISAECRKGFGQ